MLTGNALFFLKMIIGFVSVYVCIASYGHWGTYSSSSFFNSVNSAAAASLAVKISKISKGKHVLHFRLSPQKHAKTHVNRLKQSRNPKKSRTGEERKKSCCAPPDLISWRRHCLSIFNL